MSRPRPSCMLLTMSTHITYPLTFLTLSPISGCQEFIGNSIEFAYGKRADNIQGVQTLSGTGGLRIFGEYLNKFFPKKNIYVPNPTWGNHIPIMQNAGLEVRKYRYYDFENRKVDFEGLIEDMDAADDGSCFLLHACAHNPTGYDLSDNEWKQVSDIMLRKNHLPFFDCAYQGFASGNAETDAKAIRLFEDEGHTFGLVQSYSKNFGLYGQRVGCLSIVGKDAEEAKAVVSQFKGLIRPAYSNPPRHGVRIINTILGDESMKALFVDECKFMADRINSMRVELVNNLIATGSTRNWDHVTNQIGMFAFSGLTKDEVIAMRDRHHIYCTLDGRISMAGVTTKNVKYIADSIHDVTK